MKINSFIVGFYFTGDGALRDKDGHYRITGRMDDVINISGKRLGTAEVEDALVMNKQQVVLLCAHMLYNPTKITAL